MIRPPERPQGSRTTDAMTKPATDKPMRRKAIAPPQSAIWAVLGAIGLGYLGIAFFLPQLLPDLSGGRQHVTESTVMKMSSDVQGLKSSLTQLELDVASVKADVAAQASQTQTLSNQLTALDDKVRLAETQAPTTKTADAGTQPASDVPAFGSGAAEASATDDDRSAVKVINATPRVGAPIETGSVNKRKAAEPISFGPAIVKPAPRPIGIQIATDPSIDGLRITWGALSQIHADTLGHLKARYADLGTATHPNFGLIAGPVKSKTAARKLCKELAAQSISCKISEYKGEAL
jgi:hypothetical protein